MAACLTHDSQQLRCLLTASAYFTQSNRVRPHPRYQTALRALGGAENAGRENAVHGTAGHHSRIDWMLSFFVLKMTTKTA